MDEGLKRGATANIEGADPLRRIDLVAGNAEQVDAEGVHIRGNLPDRLCRVGVEETVVSRAP